MPVPETAVDEDGFAEAWKYQIGITRKIAAVQPEPVTQRVGHPSNAQLG
jgi:hypothetical protein